MNDRLWLSSLVMISDKKIQSEVMFTPIEILVRLQLSRWPCTGMIDRLRVHVMSRVCYDWSSVGAGMTVETATGSFLTDRCTIPDIHTTAPSCIVCQIVDHETLCAREDQCTPNVKRIVINQLTKVDL